MNEILETHCISPEFLRSDDFEGFMRVRKASLSALVETAMGKVAIASEASSGDDEAVDEYEELCMGLRPTHMDETLSFEGVGEMIVEAGPAGRRTQPPLPSGRELTV